MKKYIIIGVAVVLIIAVYFYLKSKKSSEITDTKSLEDLATKQANAIISSNPATPMQVRIDTAIKSPVQKIGAALKKPVVIAPKTLATQAKSLLMNSATSGRG